MAFTVALDAVALYVNIANPLTQAGLEQVDAIFSASPRCGGSESFERWGQLGAPLAAGDFADRRIGLYAPANGSGTRTVFRDLALCGARLQRHTRALPGTRSVSRAVAESRYAIGVGTLAGTAPRIRALALPSSDGSGFAVPTPDEVRSGRYPFSRELLLVAAPAADGSLEPSARAFLALALSDTGQRIAKAAGFVTLTPEGLVRERARLDAASH